ncbi:MAG: carboxypeptidase-like regulatory domain-containing protein, partial [Bacteroidota bacterium]
MRLFLFTLSFFVGLWLPALTAQSELLVSYDFSDLPLSSALANLEERYDLTFSYRDDLIAGRNVSARATKLDLPAALERLFAVTPIAFRVVKDRYVLLLAKEVALPEKPEAVTKRSPFQLFKVKGRVVDAASGEGIPFASVQVLASGSAGYANTEGYFELALRATATDSVEFASLGYTSKRWYLPDLLNGSSSVSLQWSSVGLADILVTAYLTDGIRASAETGQIQLSPSRINLLPGQAEPDILRSLLLLPGVASATESVADINIRGGTADQNLVLWDGIPIYHTGHYFGSFTAFNPFI